MYFQERLKLCHVTGLIQSLWNFCQNNLFWNFCQIDILCQSWGKLKLLYMKINFIFSGGQKLRIVGRSWNFLRSQFRNLEQFFETLSEYLYARNLPNIWLFCISKLLIVWCRYNQVIRVNVKETSYFTAGFAFHKMFKSVVRFVNAAIKQNPRLSRNRLYSLEGLKLCNVTGMTQWSSHFCKNFFFWNFGRKSISKNPRRTLNLLKNDKIYVLLEWCNFVRSQLMIQSL